MPVLVGSVRSPAPSASRCGVSREPVTVAADCDDVAVMEEAIEDSGRDHGIAEHG
jgi:hypothetical protein